RAQDDRRLRARGDAGPRARRRLLDAARAMRDELPPARDGDHDLRVRVVRQPRPVVAHRVADRCDPDHRGDRLRAAAARGPVPAFEGDPCAGGPGALAAEDHHKDPRSGPDRGRDRVVQRGPASRVGADAGHLSGSEGCSAAIEAQILASRAHGCSLRDPERVRGGCPMSATNLDVPVLISAEQIRRREFVTIRRGYDPDQVRAYLVQLADQIELMRVLLRDAQAEAQTARRTTEQPRQDPYQQLGERVASVIREADHAAEAITGEAHREAERVTREARADADRIRTDAQAKAEDARSRAETAVRTARQEADRTIAGLSTRRDALVDQIASMQERLIGVARDLESAMDVQFTIPDIPAIKDLLDEP